MRDRKIIQSEINSKILAISKLRQEIKELSIENAQLCDKKQWYIEKEETRIVSKKPKVVETVMVGRNYWIEYFLDEDTGKKFPIERNEVVRVNGEWLL